MDQSSVRKFICLVILSHEENILADFYMCYNHMDQSSVRKFICLVILSHEENILADFYVCYNHTLWC